MLAGPERRGTQLARSGQIARGVSDRGSLGCLHLHLNVTEAVGQLSSAKKRPDLESLLRHLRDRLIDFGYSCRLKMAKAFFKMSRSRRVRPSSSRN